MCWSRQGWVTASGRLNQRAVALAQTARENAAAGRPVAIAGSLSSFRADVSPAEQLEASYREQAELLAEAGVDLIALEMMSNVERATPAIRRPAPLACPSGSASVAGMAGDGAVRLLDGSPFSAGLGQTLDLLADLPVDTTAVTVMHTLTEESAPALDVVRQQWSGTTGVYAHSGRWIDPNWQFDDMISPRTI